MNKKKKQQQEDMKEIMDIFVKYEFENWMYEIENKFGENIAMQHCTPANFEKYMNSWSSQQLHSKFSHFLTLFNRSLDHAEKKLNSDKNS